MTRLTVCSLSLIMAATAVGCAPAPDPVPSPSPPEPMRSVMTSEAQRGLTPAAVLEDLKAGNQRFAEGRLTEENVRQTMADIIARSPVISELVAGGDLALVGGVYDLATGRVTWLD